ncbi:MAG: transcriptional regulator [Polyangia bacterium]
MISPGELGSLVRLTRKAAGFLQVDAAGMSKVGVRFFSELERGKPTLELGKVFGVLSRLGLEVWILPRGRTPFGEDDDR